MRLEYDVLVIGSGTTGCYFARRMAEKGYKVCVAEAAKAETLGERLAVFHIDKEMFKKMDVPRPEPGDADYVSEFAAGTYYSPYGQYTRRNDPDETIIYAHYPFLVCKLPPFVQRLRAWCREAGVVFLDEAKCKGLLYCKHGVRGAALEHEGKTKHVFARLVADCSGIASVARRCLRKPTKVEGFKIGPRDMMYVLLEYVKLAHPEKDAPQRAEHWAYYKGWIAQTPNPDEAIIGVGANLSYEHAQTCMDRFKAAVQMPEGEVVRRERGVIPYRHPPYSLVDNGFVCLGDAACMNKWVGEGICSSWVGAKAAAEVAGRALQSGAYPTERALWPFNVIYNTTQQADFAYINATAINAIDCTADEMDYEFRKGIVFHNKAMTRLNREYSAELPIDEVIVLVGKVIGGLATRNISVSTLQGLLKGIGCSTLLKAHYQNYPKTPAGYEKWAATANKLWQTCGTMADVIERCEARVAG